MTTGADLAEAAWAARREGRQEDAEQALIEVIGVARRSGSVRDLIRALKYLAHVVRDQGQDERALPLYEEALALSRSEGDPMLLAHTVRHLGDLHRDVGRLTDADRCYEEALLLYRAAPAPKALDFANAVRPAALLKEVQGDVQGARRLWSEARRLYEGFPEAVAECDRFLCQLGE